MLGVEPEQCRANTVLRRAIALPTDQHVLLLEHCYKRVLGCSGSYSRPVRTSRTRPHREVRQAGRIIFQGAQGEGVRIAAAAHLSLPFNFLVAPDAPDS